MVSLLFTNINEAIVRRTFILTIYSTLRVVSGILPREKSQEIKTVRIVKRESERRQRDRDRNNVGVPITSNLKRINVGYMLT